MERAIKDTYPDFTVPREVNSLVYVGSNIQCCTNWGDL